MHKFFAKTGFVGKNIISLPECHSTNDFLIALARSGDVINGTIVQTDFQTLGRGQRGNVWESEPGMNLTFSAFITQPLPLAKNLYRLNILAALSLHRVLQPYLSPSHRLEVKWPNDLYLNDRKLAGILVESSILGEGLEWFVLGIGLNVNQMNFSHPLATSLLKEGIVVESWPLLEEFSIAFESLLKEVNEHQFSSLVKEYYRNLRWMGEERKYLDLDHREEFMGRIRGIDENGRLRIQIGTEEKHYDVKQLKFLA